MLAGAAGHRAGGPEVSLRARGLERPTKGIALLVDASPDNIERIKRALAVLSDNAVRGVWSDEMERDDVIRVADEVIVDLMSNACGVTWKEAAGDSKSSSWIESRFPIAESRR